ncbi:MAG TPA: hypothetical protein VGP08_10735, partial [Pyrinomonadaceae bacterium]|nr:hypothetical protein [Pyrinomonadaceae bacterium]
VCGGRVFGPHAFPREIEEGCVRLSALVSMPLLGVEFGRGESGEWQFASATPLPDLSAGGEPLLDALAEELGASKTNDSPSAEGAGAAREMEAVR